MKMDMKDRLTSSFIIVADDPEPFFRDTPFIGDPGGNPENVPYQRDIGLLHINDIHEMLSRNYQEVCRRNWSNVLDNDHLSILIYLL
jgi:hypothetical protein